MALIKLTDLTFFSDVVWNVNDTHNDIFARRFRILRNVFAVWNHRCNRIIFSLDFPRKKFCILNFFVKLKLKCKIRSVLRVFEKRKLANGLLHRLYFINCIFDVISSF